PSLNWPWYVKVVVWPVAALAFITTTRSKRPTYRAARIPLGMGSPPSKDVELAAIFAAYAGYGQPPVPCASCAQPPCGSFGQPLHRCPSEVPAGRAIP